MTRSFKADQDTRRHEIAEHPIPHRRCTGLVVCLSEDIACVVESVGLGDCNGQPNDVEEEVKQDDPSRYAENRLVGLWIKIIHTDRDEQDAFGHNPLYGTEADISGVRCEGQLEDRDLREQKVRGGLAVAGNKRRPGGCAPPGHDKPEKPAIPTATGFRSPEVDRSSGWQCRANLS